MTAKAYLLKIRGGVEVDSKGQKAGKGPLIVEEISNTLGTSQDQYLFQPVGVDLYNQCLTGDKAKTLNAIKSDADHVPVVLESHPNDSRVKIDDSGSIQTLTSRMGTGGGNVPMVMMPYSKSRRAKSAEDFETWKESRVSNTINTFDQGDVRATDVVVCIQGNVIDRSDNAGANGAGWRLNQCYTLNTIDRPAVVYATGNGQVDNMALSDKFGALDCMHDQNFLALAVENHPQDSRVKISEDNVNQPLSANMEHDASNGGLVLTLETFHLTTEEDKTAPLKARDYKDPLVIAMDRAAFNQGKNALYDFTILEEQSPTIVARGPNAVCVRKKED